MPHSLFSVPFRNYEFVHCSLFSTFILIEFHFTGKDSSSDPFMSFDAPIRKTILIVGATGSGKSTLLEGMINHLIGVKWEDDVRFSAIHLSSEEAEHAKDQVC